MLRKFGFDFQFFRCERILEVFRFVHPDSVGPYVRISFLEQSVFLPAPALGQHIARRRD